MAATFEQMQQFIELRAENVSYANKKDLRFERKSLMVELAGTAPASAGLSWLVVYRHSSF